MKIDGPRNSCIRQAVLKNELSIVDLLSQSLSELNQRLIPTQSLPK